AAGRAQHAFDIRIEADAEQAVLLFERQDPVVEGRGVRIGAVEIGVEVGLDPRGVEADDEARNVRLGGLPGREKLLGGEGFDEPAHGVRRGPKKPAHGRSQGAMRSPASSDACAPATGSVGKVCSVRMSSKSMWALNR